MPSDVTREEFEARVGVLECEVEGERMATRHILEQIRRNSDDLAAIKARLDRVEVKVDLLGHELRDLSKNLRGIVAGAVREAQRERDENR